MTKCKMWMTKMEIWKFGRTCALNTKRIDFATGFRHLAAGVNNKDKVEERLHYSGWHPHHHVWKKGLTVLFVSCNREWFRDDCSRRRQAAGVACPRRHSRNFTRNVSVTGDKHYTQLIETVVTVIIVVYSLLLIICNDCDAYRSFACKTYMSEN